MELKQEQEDASSTPSTDKLVHLASAHSTPTSSALTTPSHKRTHSLVSPSIKEAVGDAVLPSPTTEPATPKQLSEWSKKPKTGEEEW
jgi:hypothetical protein